MKLSNNLSIDNIINSYKRRGYYGQQLDAIRQGLERGFDVSIYDDKRFDHEQMYEILTGLKYNIDVSIYADLKYSFMLMKYIRQALSHGVDHDKLVAYLEQPQYNEYQLNQILMGLCDDLDTSKFDSYKIDSRGMNEIRRGLENGVDIASYVARSSSR